jgi:hypothetical protein
MDAEGKYPLDDSDFRCASSNGLAVVVVFDPTNRHYTYFWHDDGLDLSHPDIVGAADPHEAEVIDCLARAVAYKAVQDAGTRPKLRPEQPGRTTADMIREWWSETDVRRSA